MIFFEEIKTYDLLFIRPIDTEYMHIYPITINFVLSFFKSCFLSFFLNKKRNGNKHNNRRKRNKGRWESLTFTMDNDAN